MENFISTEAGTALSNRVAGSRVKAGPSCTDCGSPTNKIETQIVRFRDHLKTKYDVLATGDESGTVVAGEEAEEVVVVRPLDGPDLRVRLCLLQVEVDVPVAPA